MRQDFIRSCRNSQLMKTKFFIGLSLASVVVSVGIIGWYLSISNPPAPLNISHSPHPTVTATPSLPPTANPTPSSAVSQSPTPTPTPAPTIIPGARPTDWNTYRNYEWQFEMKIPPNWTAKQVGYGLVISGDKAAVRIDTDGVSWDGPAPSPSITTSTIDGQPIEIADCSSFALKRNSVDIPF
jgi:hypothetical protein